MKRILFLLVFVLSIAVLASCQKYNAFDVEEVVFPKEGGTVTINNWTCQGCTIYSDSGQSQRIRYPIDTSNPTFPLKTTYAWLTVEYKSYTQLELTAEPNETGKSRQLNLDSAVQNHPSSIPVIQK